MTNNYHYKIESSSRFYLLTLGDEANEEDGLILMLSSFDIYPMQILELWF